MDLFNEIKHDTTIITPNRRLSATLHKLYAKKQIQNQHNSWETPDILPLSAWTQRLWKEYTLNQCHPFPLLLNNAQEQYIWEGILLNAKENAYLLQLSETAELVRSAWNLLKQWRVDFNTEIFKCSEDYAAFQNWALAFHATCQKNNWLDASSLADVIAEKINLRLISPQGNIILVGFTEITPQFQYILEACRSNGSVIHHQTLEKYEQQIQYRLSVEDDETEILSMALWAKDILQRNTESSVACVIPNLDKIRDQVMRIFSEVFAPDNCFTIDPDKSPFNISAGKSLNRYPIVNTGLQILSLKRMPIYIDDFCHLLNSPFLGEAESERIKRAKYDFKLRKYNYQNIHLSNNNVRKSLEQACPYFSKRLQDFTTYLQALPKLQHYATWAKDFTTLLNLLGWPGERSLSSHEYQVVEGWLELLSNLKSLDILSTPVTYEQALNTLNKISSKTIFQVKTPEAPIQILGVLEAAGLPIEHVWMSGMDDLSWPPQPKPNPFIPKSLQRELHMPHATAERELIFCETLISQFIANSKSILFSHVKKRDDLELQASPLIRHSKEISIAELQLPKHTAIHERIYQTRNIESLADEVAPAYLTDIKINGGVDILKQQALCPFKAFATHRLHARELETPLPGLRARDRGSILHKALELIWNKLQNHHSLISIETDSLHELIDECIQEALNINHSHSDSILYMELEKQRIHKLMMNWLEIEKLRQPFKVSATECKKYISIGRLSFDLRIDRIDELHDGSTFIIDYKTGKNNDINNWFNDRLDEPQLPIYAQLEKQSVAGIGFAQMFPGEFTFKGVSKHSLDIKGIKLLSDVKKATAATWQDQLDHWHKVLTTISDDFYTGKAHVDPKDKQTCLWCVLKPLCRINDTHVKDFNGEVINES